MRHLFQLILCLMIATPVLADDGPAKKAPQGKTKEKLAVPEVPNPFDRPGPANKTLREANKKGDQTIRSSGDPFAQNPFGQSAGKKKQHDDPFGRPAKKTSDDPFGGPAKKTSDDPFGGPAPRKSAATKRAPAKPAVPKAQAANVVRHRSTIPSITVSESSRSRDRIEAQLEVETEFDYLDTPLKDVLEDISLRHDIPIIINVRALEDFGIGTDTPITINVKGISLRSALRLMLRDLDLTFLIKDEVLQITTPEQSEATLRSKFYAVSELLPADRDGDYLVELIRKHVAPDSWDEVGGPGAISFVQHLESLAVSQTEDVLHEIDTLLEAVARLAKK